MCLKKDIITVEFVLNISLTDNISVITQWEGINVRRHLQNYHGTLYLNNRKKQFSRFTLNNRGIGWVLEIGRGEGFNHEIYCNAEIVILISLHCFFLYKPLQNDLDHANGKLDT